MYIGEEKKNKINKSLEKLQLLLMMLETQFNKLSVSNHDLYLCRKSHKNLLNKQKSRDRPLNKNINHE